MARIVRELECGSRAGFAFVKKLLKPRLARRNHGHLGHREKSVDDEEQQQDGEFHKRSDADTKDPRIPRFSGSPCRGTAATGPVPYAAWSRPPRAFRSTVRRSDRALRQFGGTQRSRLPPRASWAATTMRRDRASARGK